MTKRKMIVGIVAALVLLLMAMPIVSGCGPAPGEAPKDWPKEATLAGGPPGTSHYLIDAYWSDLLLKEYGIKATPVTGASETNVMEMGKGNVVAGMCSNALAAIDGVTGKGLFADVGPQPVRLMQMTSEFFVQVLTLRESGIKSFADIKGKRNKVVR